MTEREIISLFYQDRSNQARAVDILDDCALVPGNGKQIVTTDAVVEGVHFCLDWSSPEDLAIKLFQVNLSDLIASGGLPNWCLLNLGLPKQIPNTNEGCEFLVRFSRAFKKECLHNECSIIGGDTFRSDKIFLSLTMGGKVKRYISRTGAKPGDHLYVTGDLGSCWFALRHLRKRKSLMGNDDTVLQALQKHLQPRAKVTWAKWLWDRVELHAMLDISDGLLNNAIHLARANFLEISIDLQVIPIPTKLKSEIKAEEAILSGEELELLFLAEPGLEFPFPCRSIGYAKDTTLKEAGVRLFAGSRDVALPLGQYEHF